MKLHKIVEIRRSKLTLLATPPFAVKACCMALLSVFAVSAWADVEYFVDAENGNDGYDGSSASFVSGSVGPMKTVGAAVARANADGEPSIVTLLPGRYDKGEYYADGMTNRIVITQPHLKIRSTGGKENTFIIGNRDPSNANGIGSAAVRGIYIKDDLLGLGADKNKNADYQATNVVIEGVTICNCATASGKHGGAVYCLTPDGGGASLLIDCVVSNCAAGSNGGALYRQNAYRTLFADNYARDAGSAMAFGVMANCIVTRNLGNATTYSMRRAVNCTFYANRSYAFYSGYGMSCFNCLSFGNNNNGCHPSGNVYVDYYYGVGADPMRIPAGRTVTGSVTNASSDQCVSPETGDWRLLSNSPAIGRGQGSRLTGANLVLPPGYSLCDYAGNPIDTSGSVDCGAFQAGHVARCVISSVGGGVEVTGGIVGTNYIDSATEITVTASDAEARPFLGFEVNGARLPASQTSYTFTVSPDSAAQPCVSAVYGTTWYVDCVGGSDSNSGGTPATAKQTIRAATTNAVANDVVLVAPGTYGAGEGAQIHPVAADADNKDAAITIGSRVLVPVNVTVRSLAGPESTLIVGGAATSGANEWGCGVGAVRCAMLQGAGALLEGFTLTGGRTAIGESGHDDNEGGGALVKGSGVVRNCIISNNVASRCGAVFHGTMIDCRIFDNKATVRASVGRESSFLRCIIDGNKGAENAIQWFSTINSCTIGPDNTYMSGDLQQVIRYRNGSSSTLVNSLVLGPVAVSASGNESYAIRNCAFRSDRSPSAQYLTDCVVTNAAMLALDGYRLVIGSNAAIDRGDATRITALIDDGLDISGNQRVMNGVMDIGAFEADWRPVYSAYMGGKRLSVTNVSSTAYANESHEVCLPSGGIDATVDVAQTSSRWFDVFFRVTGNGTFTISINGTPFASYTYAAGAQRAHIPVPTGEMGIRFEYVPGENDTGNAIIESARLVRGFVLSFR